ncbi:MAG: thioredoxin family protein [Rhizobiaceae bacterium]|nr:thioredoxin family protein [Rhizobiaceae bacterium]
MLNRRNFTAGGALALSAVATNPSFSQSRQKVEVNEDGLHVQPWFLDSFLEVAEDQAELAAENKHLAVVFEQRGCPYCREMHEVNLAIPQIVDYLKENFGILQINIWGGRIVTDLDGEELPEKDFARKWKVNFTPTIVFLRLGDLENAPLALAESARMPGYLKPFQFLSMFEFVAQKNYEEQNFQSFMKDKLARYEAEGKKPEIL